MERILLLTQSNVFNLFKLKSLQLLIVVFVVLGSSTKVQGQCIGPYQYFESCKIKGVVGPPATGMIADGWVFGSTATTVTNNVTFARSGSSFASLPSSGQTITTPKLLTPDKFQFYYRSSSSTNNVNLKVEWSTDNTFATGVSSTNFTTNYQTYGRPGLIKAPATVERPATVSSQSPPPNKVAVVQPVPGEVH